MSSLSDAISRSLHQRPAPKSQFDERREVLAYLDAVLKWALAQTHHLKGDFSQPIDRMILPLYATMIQLAEGISRISNYGPSVATPTLARQFLDALVDFRALLEKPNYWEFLECADDMFWMTVLTKASEGKSPFLESIRNSPDLAQRRKDLKARIDKWKRKGIRSLDVKERFQVAKMSDDYVVWRMLSSFTHNNSSSLIGRHFTLKEDEPPAQMDIHPDRVPYELGAIIQVADILVISTTTVQEKFGAGKLDSAPIQDIQKRIESYFGEAGVEARQLEQSKAYGGSSSLNALSEAMRVSWPPGASG